jgi:hypothetical protein
VVFFFIRAIFIQTNTRFRNLSNAFVSRKVVSGKPLSKLFLYLFAIKKIGQQKTLSGQQKTLSIKEKFGLGRVCFPESGFREIISKLSCVCLPLEKLVDRKYFPVNEKHFLVKEKFGLVSRKVFSFYYGRKTLSGSCEKFINVILFAEYIKFGPQTFDCYIYFVLNIFFFNFIP